MNYLTQSLVQGIRVVIEILLLVSLGACDQSKEEIYSSTFSDFSLDTETEYVSGIHPLYNPQRLYEVFGPMMDYLSKQIDGVTFKLEASRNYAAYDKKLYSK